MQPESESERKFIVKLRAKVEHMKYYKNKRLLEEALQTLPADDLKVKATVKLSLLSDVEGITFEDCMILELLYWFKNSFYSWLDVPRCEDCDRTMNSKTVTDPTASECMWDVAAVEQYQCPGCRQIFRFPRYNHPAKLLETRTGRCGEWSMCFTLFCLALGYEARLVIDWTDHAWTEVFSKSRNKWMHCDCCEEVYDKPLLYEKGWKKRMNYVIAFSTTDVQDVTWRYTTRFRDVLRGRNFCREEFLLYWIRYFQEMMERSLSVEERSRQTLRRIVELAEFLTPPKDEGDGYGGRTSGGLNWRLARGEVSPTLDNGYVFTLSAEEIEARRFHVKYSCVADAYVRGNQRTKEWSSMVFSYRNVFRKVEKDWGFGYLSRTEDSTEGDISWKFNFKESGLVMDAVDFTLKTDTFHSGKVEWFLHFHGQSKQFSPTDKSSYEKDLKKCSEFRITAELGHGTFWQHSQLFRQLLTSPDFPFEIEISFVSEGESDMEL